MDGLIVKQPHAQQIIDGVKKWEMRAWPPPRSKLGMEIYLLSGGYVLGVIRLTGFVGPLTASELRRARDWHLGTSPRYRYGWIVRVVRRYARPRRYKHPPGAQIWVRNVRLLK